jgi:hypothetical protein
MDQESWLGHVSIVASEAKTVKGSEAQPPLRVSIRCCRVAIRPFTRSISA